MHFWIVSGVAAVWESCDAHLCLYVFLDLLQSVRMLWGVDTGRQRPVIGSGDEHRWCRGWILCLKCAVCTDQMDFLEENR